MSDHHILTRRFLPPSPRQEEALARALERFNRGEYRAALDDLEEAYHEVEGRRRLPWLGFIRAAAALHHATSGHPASARRLYLSARELLGQLEPHWAGLDVAAFRRSLEPVFAPLLAGGDAPALAVPPRLEHAP